ncbi:MAG: hypothetical protein MZU79_07595 [Anaerotruncus sp.]|nr:hypothetical protein [Anaerotruncus sp.]
MHARHARGHLPPAGQGGLVQQDPDEPGPVLHLRPGRDPARRPAGSSCPAGCSSCRACGPDTDASGPFTRLLEKIEATPEEALPPERPEGPAHRIPARLPQRRPGARGPRGGRDVRFLRSGEARGACSRRRAGRSSGSIPSYGTPPQGYVYVAKARDANGKP